MHLFYWFVWRLTGLVASEVQLAVVDFRSTIDFNPPPNAIICGFNINQICSILEIYEQITMVWKASFRLRMEVAGFDFRRLICLRRL
jgi:hypothetical protein